MKWVPEAGWRYISVEEWLMSALLEVVRGRVSSVKIRDVVQTSLDHIGLSVGRS